MSEKSFKKIYIDSKRSLRITIDEGSRTVVAELETSNGLEFIYAEQFSKPCNYLKTAIKRCIEYMDKSDFDNKTDNSAVLHKNINRNRYSPDEFQRF